MSISVFDMFTVGIGPSSSHTVGKQLAFHPNAMTFEATGADDKRLSWRTCYSVGGGFVLDDTETDGPRIVPDSTPVRHPFTTGAELLAPTKAITAARMPLHGDGTHHVTLDNAIATLRKTGADMKDKYEETARGGLALNVVEC